MAITSAISSGPYTGNGSQTAFPFSFTAMSSADVVVLVDVAAVSSALYSVSINSDGNSGTVTFGTAPAVGAEVLIEQLPDFVQDSQFLNEAAYSLASVNAINRRQSMRANWLNVESGRTIRVPRGEVGYILPSASDRANGFMSFDAAGDPVIAPLVYQEVSGVVICSSRTVLASISGPTSGQHATLTEPGREGAFIFSAANLSAEVAADTYQGLYVAPASDSTGASGAWVRQVQIAPYVSPQYRASWWGLGSGAASTNHLRLKAAHDLIPAGATLILPNETFATQGLSGTNCLLAITKAMRLTGAGPACKLDLSHATARTGSGIVVLASNVEIDGFEITGHHVTRGADPWFNIFIGSRFRYTASSATIENVKVHDMRISDGTAAIAIHHAVWLEGGVQVQYSPTRIKIYDNTITGMDYRGIVPEADQIEIYGNRVIMDTAVSYADVGHAAFRVIGCDDVSIHDNFVVPHPGTPAFILTGSGIDGAHNVGVATWFRDARNVRIYGNTVQGKCTNGFQVEKVGKSIEIYDNTLDADIAATDSHRAMLFFGNTSYVAQAEIVVRDNKARGFNILAHLAGGYFKNVSILDNEVIGNSKTGSTYEGATFLCNNGNIARIEFLRMRGNSHLVHESLVGYPIYLNVMQSGTFSFEDNLLPTPPGGTGGNVVAFVSPVTANVRVSPSDAFSTITATTYYNGSNRYWPAGTFAAAIDDIIASPRATA